MTAERSEFHKYIGVEEWLTNEFVLESKTRVRSHQHKW